MDRPWAVKRTCFGPRKQVIVGITDYEYFGRSAAQNKASCRRRDHRHFFAKGDDLAARYGALAATVPGFGAATHYGELVTPAALSALRGDVDGLGPWIASLVQASPAPAGAADPRPRLGASMAPWLAEARRLGFAVHAYTVRAEPPYRFVDADGVEQAPEALVRQLAAAGVTGVFADQPGLAAGVRDALRHEDAARTPR